MPVWNEKLSRGLKTPRVCVIHWRNVSVLGLDTHCHLLILSTSYHSFQYGFVIPNETFPLGNPSISHFHTGKFNCSLISNKSFLLWHIFQVSVCFYFGKCTFTSLHSIKNMSFPCQKHV